MLSDSFFPLLGTAQFFVVLWKLTASTNKKLLELAEWWGIKHH
nr:MAG TPA: hypothetical protein [Caudoviricetes sp.]